MFIVVIIIKIVRNLPCCQSSFIHLTSNVLYHARVHVVNIIIIATINLIQGYCSLRWQCTNNSCLWPQMAAECITLSEKNKQVMNSLIHIVECKMPIICTKLLL